MELRHLAYFLAVAQEGNFTRAADRALVAQPAISQQILRLERELGEKLFDRTPNGARLTQAGRVLLPHARAILAGADRARDALTSLRGLMTGRLALGSVQTPPTALARLLGRFREDHPGVQLSVREAHTEPLVQALRDGELDVALIGLGRRQETPTGLHARVIAIEPVAVIVHRDHPLAQRTSVALSQLRDQPWVTMPEGSGQRTMLDDAARAAGFSPRSPPSPATWISSSPSPPSVSASHLSARQPRTSPATSRRCQSRARGLSAASLSHGVRRVSHPPHGHSSR